MGRVGTVRGSDGRCNAPRFAAAAVALAIAGAEFFSPEIGNGGAGTRRDFADLPETFADCVVCKAPVFSAFKNFFRSLARRADAFENARAALFRTESATRAASRAACAFFLATRCAFRAARAASRVEEARRFAAANSVFVFKNLKLSFSSRRPRARCFIRSINRRFTEVPATMKQL